MLGLPDTTDTRIQFVQRLTRYFKNIWILSYSESDVNTRKMKHTLEKTYFCRHWKTGLTIVFSNTDLYS